MNEINKVYPIISINNGGEQNHVYVNGREIDGLIGFSLSQEGGSSPVFHLDIRVGELQVCTPCELELPKLFNDWYEPITAEIRITDD